MIPVGYWCLRPHGRLMHSEFSNRGDPRAKPRSDRSRQELAPRVNWKYPARISSSLTRSLKKTAGEFRIWAILTNHRNSFSQSGDNCSQSFRNRFSSRTSLSLHPASSVSIQVSLEELLCSIPIPITATTPHVLGSLSYKLDS